MKVLILPFRRLTYSLGLLLLTGVSLLMIFSALDHLDLLSPDFAFYGIDFLPTHWLVLCAVPAVVLLRVGGSRRLHVGLVIASSIYLGLFGDFSLSPIDRALRSSRPVVDPQVSIATLNIQYFSMGIENGFRAIKSLNADIVLLGENTLGPDSIAAYQSLIHPYVMVSGHANSTALLTRFPLLWWREVDLPSREASLSGSNDPETMDQHPHRSFIHAIVSVDSLPVHVISVRFIAGRPKDHTLKEGLRWGKYLLNAQREETAFLLSYLQSLRGPVIFGGDLNATPGSKTLRPLHAIATDAYLEHHFWGAPTFRTEMPMQRLDYLFCMNGVAVVEADRPVIAVSDHFPVRGRFAISTVGSNGASNLVAATYSAPEGGDGRSLPVTTR